MMNPSFRAAYRTQGYRGAAALVPPLEVYGPRLPVAPEQDWHGGTAPLPVKVPDGEDEDAVVPQRRTHCGLHD